MPFRDLHPELSTWVEEVNDRLASLVAHEDTALRRAGEAVLCSRGKRLRPVMLLLSCAAYGPVTSRALTHAMLLEMIHTASLTHDDVVDEADARRGEPSAPARWGSKFSVLLGDFLLAQVFELSAQEGELAILRRLGAMATEMGRAVIKELSDLTLDTEEAEYWQIVRGKTAAMFAAAAEIGAVLGGASPAQQAVMYTMGQAFGCAFQLADDILDLQEGYGETGKASGTDWRQRRATLPVIVALRTAPPREADALRALWACEDGTPEQLLALRLLVAAQGGFTYCWQQVAAYQQTASRMLEECPDSPGRTALQRFCQEVFPLPILPR